MTRTYQLLRQPAVLLLLSIFAIFLVGSAFASPKVGDYLKFEMTNVDSRGATMKMSIEKELVAYDAEEEAFVVRETQTPISPAGPATVDETLVPASDFMSVAEVEEQVKNCANRGGRAERVKVPAGEFAACRIKGDAPDASQSIWYARVPEGIVKSEMKDPTTRFSTRIELIQFRFGR